MNVDIYIREKSGTREIRIPLLPEELQFPSGETVGISYEIMGLGEVVIPSGTELDGYAWKSAFPGEQRKNDPMIRGSWIDPKTYDSILKDWKQNGTKLNLLVTGYPINADVYLKKYNGTATGAFGDISYEIEFMEAREIVVTTTKVQQTTTTTRPATTSTTYTIKKGDNLWSIAKQFYGAGSKWGVIYNSNKDIIEKTAKKHGKKSSDNGHWIYPGVTLTIPDASGSSTASKPTTATTTTKKPETTTASGQATQEKIQAYTSQRGQAINEMVDSLKK